MEGEKGEAVAGLSQALRRYAGELISKKAARGLLRERNAAREALKALEEKANQLVCIKRNRLLERDLAEKDTGAGRQPGRPAAARPVAQKQTAAFGPTPQGPGRSANADAVRSAPAGPDFRRTRPAGAPAHCAPAGCALRPVQFATSCARGCASSA